MLLFLKLVEVAFLGSSPYTYSVVKKSQVVMPCDLYDGNHPRFPEYTFNVLRPLVFLQERFITYVVYYCVLMPMLAHFVIGILSHFGYLMQWLSRKSFL